MSMFYLSKSIYTYTHTNTYNVIFALSATTVYCFIKNKRVTKGPVGVSVTLISYFFLKILQKLQYVFLASATSLLFLSKHTTNKCACMCVLPYSVGGAMGKGKYVCHFICDVQALEMD